MSSPARIFLISTVFLSCMTQVHTQLTNCCCRCITPFGGGDCWCKHGGFCNGVRECNAMCCGCDGGCWKDEISDQHHDRSGAGISNASVVDPKVRFATVDTNADGFITMEEIFEFTGPNWHGEADKAKVQFAAIDKDGDGRINWSEFENQD